MTSRVDPVCSLILKIFVGKLPKRARILSRMGWITDSRFHVRFNSISDITGRLEGDNERLFVLEPRLPMKGFLRSTGIEPRTGRSADQRCTHREPDSHEIHGQASDFLSMSQNQSLNTKKNFFTHLKKCFSLAYRLHQTAERVRLSAIK